MILLQALAALALLLVVQSMDDGNSPIGQAGHMSDSTEKDISQNILNPSNHSMVGRLCPNLMRRDVSPQSNPRRRLDLSRKLIAISPLRPAFIIPGFTMDALLVAIMPVRMISS
ncbi:hypothetical protein FRC19_002227 [Serendipita sp. 401]|nr:hypothetical protein FRC15_008547 [Serendipita sp. 397]KAG8806087.1 hypothetical protein FRC18_006293 [Serendipita sp. 400]KAG8813709.1 hypothetical protein FRC19_002227 [Serendipita sp. 401]KAG8879536.1 hypothetical protein FRC20_000108 [Serendipita sp. 405]KAG9021420.1 hypothetical protein FS842_006610 [Serendipita sp. 407]